MTHAANVTSPLSLQGCFEPGTAGLLRRREFYDLLAEFIAKTNRMAKPPNTRRERGSRKSKAKRRVLEREQKRFENGTRVQMKPIGHGPLGNPQKASLDANGNSRDTGGASSSGPRQDRELLMPPPPPPISLAPPEPDAPSPADRKFRIAYVPPEDLPLPEGAMAERVHHYQVGDLVIGTQTPRSGGGRKRATPTSVAPCSQAKRCLSLRRNRCIR